jgi:membrane associated rhomboid family serine protease
MLLPIQHENMSARRWPVITLGLILVNFVAFLGTNWVMEKQDSKLSQVREHILILAARNPELILTPEVQEWRDAFRSQDPAAWADLQDPNVEVLDDWDARMRQIDDPAALQTEMDSIASQYSTLLASSIDQRYAFVSAHPRLIAYLTSNFLHLGWFHLLCNMWFLWLAGFVLEDAWGRTLYLLVYMTAGAVACQVYAWASPGSIAPLLGASGAVSGLMGAFLVRFPRMKIRMMWFFDLGLFPFSRFWIRAYWILPVWALLEINYGTGPRDGIGHWAHVGGFLFGGIAAVALRYSGVEHKANKAIEEKVAWTPEPEISQANVLMEQGKLLEAAATLNEYLATNPDSFAAWNLLRAVHWRASNIPAYRQATCKLCDLHVRAREYETGWQDYEDFLNAGGERIPPDVWLDLCRVPEEQQDFERALSEYEKLAAAYPSERQSLMAQLGAARICLKQLNRPQDALRLYEAASNSPVPHLELEQGIQSGIREAKAALSQSKARSAGAMLLFVGSVAFLVFSLVFPVEAQVHVRGYFRKDGTYVQPHERRSSKNGSTSFHSKQGTSSGTGRDSHERIKRSRAAKNAFEREHPCPSTGKNAGPCPGYVVDHVNPLECGGADSPSNMQWQTAANAKTKDKTEGKCRR